MMNIKIMNIVIVKVVHWFQEEENQVIEEKLMD